MVKEKKSGHGGAYRLLSVPKESDIFLYLETI